MPVFNIISRLGFYLSREEICREKAERTHDETARKKFIAEADHMLYMAKWVQSPKGQQDIQETLDLVSQLTAYRGDTHRLSNIKNGGGTHYIG